MPLTALQKDVLAVLARNRSEESHFAGGIVLNAADNSARYSHDFDIFHELAEEVTRASTKDVESLRSAGFQVETVSRVGEWEKETTFRKARVSAGTRTLKLIGPPILRFGFSQSSETRSWVGDFTSLTSRQ